MEIFLDEVSQFLTRFGNLKWSDWLRRWSHDIGTRFHEIWCLKRCWMWFGLKKMWNILLKRLLQHRDLLNKSFRSTGTLTRVRHLVKEFSRDLAPNEMCERFSRRILVDCGTGVVLADNFCLETVTFRPKSPWWCHRSIFSNRKLKAFP